MSKRAVIVGLMGLVTLIAAGRYGLGWQLSRPVPARVGPPPPELGDCLGLRRNSVNKRRDRENINRLEPRDSMLFMIVEHFKGDAVPVYRRFRDHGRLAPEGLRYISSWVTQDLLHCFQVMECDDPLLLQEWIDRWKDLADFEVTPVVTSAEAAAAIALRL